MPSRSFMIFLCAILVFEPADSLPETTIPQTVTVSSIPISNITEKTVTEILPTGKLPTQKPTGPVLKAPEIFPMENSTAKPVDEGPKNISATTLKTSTDTELEDLNKLGDMAPPATEKGNETDISAIPLEPKEAYFGVEQIQNENNTEDKRVLESKLEPRPGPNIPLMDSELAAILAGIFAVISIIGYLGLLSWRRFLENRYGNREMLVNEEEFYDPNDMRNFSL